MDAEGWEEPEGRGEWEELRRCETSAAGHGEKEGGWRKWRFAMHLDSERRGKDQIGQRTGSADGQDVPSACFMIQLNARLLSAALRASPPGFDLSRPSGPVLFLRTTTAVIKYPSSLGIVENRYRSQPSAPSRPLARPSQSLLPITSLINDLITQID